MSQVRIEVLFCTFHVIVSIAFLRLLFIQVKEATNGTVFFGVEPMVINVTMQPFRFDALPLVPASQAPQVRFID